MADWLEFTPDDKGKFDEMVARFGDGMVHAEMMDKGSLYIGLYWDDGRVCQVWINSGKPLRVHHEKGRADPPRFNAQGVEQATATGVSSYRIEPWDVPSDHSAGPAKESDALPEHLRWRGEGPEPASWMVGSTKVYRSYADYCDD